ncbi:MULTISPECIES: ribbon-helix-helix domain-containing protein [unclassified Rathayibacter]|uniref:ribbon-helix-helix domain-containing protein n=1 Tax=unclassified Rathayibacter TaxID=2609250 RepID=UPI0011B0E5DB|nr:MULTISPECIES: ribbon-helix-helix domain-containing protein [unclassified Rathayibacter]MBO0984898.1 hypothetical protein [Rathayibacter sp. SD072]
MSENRFAAAGRAARPKRAQVGEGTFVPPTQLAVFSVRLPQESIRAVKILAAEQGVPVQVLAAEAFQLLLAQYEGRKADDK